jgi:hypothetical protein
VPCRRIAGRSRRRLAFGFTGSSVRAACTANAPMGEQVVPEGSACIIKHSGPTHCNGRVERALVARKFPRSLPAQPPHVKFGAVAVLASLRASGAYLCS